MPISIKNSNLDIVPVYKVHFKNSDTDNIVIDKAYITQSNGDSTLVYQQNSNKYLGLYKLNTGRPFVWFDKSNNLYYVLDVLASKLSVFDDSQSNNLRTIHTGTSFGPPSGFMYNPIFGVVGQNTIEDILFMCNTDTVNLYRFDAATPAYRVVPKPLAPEVTTEAGETGYVYNFSTVSITCCIGSGAGGHVPTKLYHIDKDLDYFYPDTDIFSDIQGAGGTLLNVEEDTEYNCLMFFAKQGSNQTILTISTTFRGGSTQTVSLDAPTEFQYASPAAVVSYCPAYKTLLRKYNDTFIVNSIEVVDGTVPYYSVDNSNYVYKVSSDEISKFIQGILINDKEVLGVVLDSPTERRIVIYNLQTNTITESYTETTTSQFPYTSDEYIQVYRQGESIVLLTTSGAYLYLAST